MLDGDIVKLGLETGLGDSAEGYRAAAENLRPGGPLVICLPYTTPVVRFENKHIPVVQEVGTPGATW